FELPVALVILVLLGWVTPAQLREWRGYAVVGGFIVAAVVTPPDVVSQLMLSIPMCLLYEAGIIAARLLAPKTEDAAGDGAAGHAWTQRPGRSRCRPDCCAAPWPGRWTCWCRWRWRWPRAPAASP